MRIYNKWWGFRNGGCDFNGGGGRMSNATHVRCRDVWSHHEYIIKSIDHGGYACSERLPKVCKGPRRGGWSAMAEVVTQPDVEKVDKSQPWIHG